jgi:hypothetical protein
MLEREALPDRSTLTGLEAWPNETDVKKRTEATTITKR